MLSVFQGRTLFLLTRNVLSRLYRTDRWSWATTNRKTISVSLWFSCESSRSPVFGNSSSRSGVMHRIALNTFGLKNSVLLILRALLLPLRCLQPKPRYTDSKFETANQGKAIWNIDTQSKQQLLSQRKRLWNTNYICPHTSRDKQIEVCSV